MFRFISETDFRGIMNGNLNGPYTVRTWSNTSETDLQSTVHSHIVFVDAFPLYYCSYIFRSETVSTTSSPLS